MPNGVAANTAVALGAAVRQQQSPLAEAGSGKPRRCVELLVGCAAVLTSISSAEASVQGEDLHSALNCALGILWVTKVTKCRLHSSSCSSYDFIHYGCSQQYVYLALLHVIFRCCFAVSCGMMRDIAGC